MGLGDPALKPVTATGSGNLKLTPGAKLYWLQVSAGATGGSGSVSDGNGGVTLLPFQAPASSSGFYGPFDPPILAPTNGLYVNISGSNITVAAAVN